VSGAVEESVDAALPIGVRARPRPDMEVRRLLGQLTLGRPPRVSPTYPVADARRDWRLAIRAFASREPVRSVFAGAIPGPGGDLSIRAYVPASGSEPRPVLLWLHGGGFVVGDLYSAGATCRALANRTGAVVVALDYRLAPEHPLEDALDDCLAALRWLSENAGMLGGDPNRLAVGGDSAGGALAALVGQQSRAHGVELAAQLLVYPATDLPASLTAPSPMAGLLTSDWTRWFSRHIAEVSDLADPRLSPMLTGAEAASPPLIIVTVGFDPLRDQGLAYADRVRAAGRPVRVLHYPGQFHGFLSFDRVLVGARDALDRIGAELRAAFDGVATDGVVADLPHRVAHPFLWLRPSQRWHETKVAAFVVGDRMLRSIRPTKRV